MPACLPRRKLAMLMYGVPSVLVTVQSRVIVRHRELSRWEDVGGAKLTAGRRGVKAEQGVLQRHHAYATKLY